MVLRAKPIVIVAELESRGAEIQESLGQGVAGLLAESRPFPIAQAAEEALSRAAAEIIVVCPSNPVN